MAGPLDRIRELTDRADEAQWQAGDYARQRREAIIAAHAAGEPVAHIAAVAGISKARVYQILDATQTPAP
jgi:hypothetical protein